jgi:hypothetical protein
MNVSFCKNQDAPAWWNANENKISRGDGSASAQTLGQQRECAERRAPSHPSSWSRLSQREHRLSATLETRRLLSAPKC